jgi:hypothetical protein
VSVKLSQVKYGIILVLIVIILSVNFADRNYRNVEQMMVLMWYNLGEPKLQYDISSWSFFTIGLPQKPFDLSLQLHGIPSPFRAHLRKIIPICLSTRTISRINQWTKNTVVSFSTTKTRSVAACLLAILSD